ncbi:FecR family protein [Acetobacter syzygii]|uniref:FecR family protein n=1 Tax=Acetobacter syzygii TaxID=146476 RepID=UPI0039EBEE88
MDDVHAAEDAAIDWSLLLNEEPDNQELRSEFERWLHESPAHVLAWEQVTAVSDIIRSAPPERRVDQSRRAGARRNLLKAWLRAPKPWRLASGIGGTAVACCLALFLAVPDLKVRLFADQYAPVGETRTLHLTDGSEVVLAPRTAISVRMTTAERHIDLVQGEAFFTVHHDSGRLFTVQAGNVRVKDIGTAFDVQKNEHETTVRVREGAVHLSSSVPQIFNRDVHAGEWSCVSDDGIQGGNLPAETVGAWKDGLLIARNDSVADLLQALAPWTHGQTVILHRGLLKQQVTGVYDLRKPDEALRLIARPLGGKVMTVSPWVRFVVSQ